MTSISTLSEVKRQLDYIDTSFIGDNEVRNVFLGKGANGTTTPAFITDISNYDNFKGKYFNTNTTPANVLDFSNVEVKPVKTQQAFVSLKNATRSGNKLISVPGGAPATSDSIVTYPNNSFEADFDINFAKVAFLQITTNKPTMDALDLLNSFTAAYNFLNPQNFATYKTNDDGVSIKDYKGTALTVAKKTGNRSTGTGYDIVNKVLNVDAITNDTTTARPDAIRRVFLGYIYLIEIYIAAYMHEKNTNSADYTTKNILETCIKKFIKLNEAMYDTTTTAGIGKLYKGLEQRMSDYKTSKNQLNTLATSIDKTKSGITLEQNYINSHTSFLKSNQTSFYLFMTIFLVLLAVLLYTYYGSMSKGAKQKVMALVSGLSLIILVLAFLTYKYVVLEPFEQNTITTTRTGLYTDIALGVFSEYLTNTINVLRLLDTYRSYGEIAQSIAKEKNYYTNVADELKLNKGELNSVQANRLREGKILRYRTYLFIQILITLSFLMLLLTYQYNILYIIIAAFIILVWVYFYVFNVNNLVRTDPKKFYWGQPDMA